MKSDIAIQGRGYDQMLRGVRRRLSHLEESFPLPLTTARFYEKAQRHGRRAGGSVEESIATLARDLSDEELESVLGEFEQIAFGSDIEARDANRRAVLSGAIQLGQLCLVKGER